MLRLDMEVALRCFAPMAGYGDGVTMLRSNGWIWRWRCDALLSSLDMEVALRCFAPFEGDRAKDLSPSFPNLNGRGQTKRRRGHLLSPRLKTAFALSPSKRAKHRKIPSHLSVSDTFADLASGLISRFRYIDESYGSRTNLKCPQA